MKVISMTMRRMGDVATDVLLDEVLGGRVDEMLLDRDANLGALLRLALHDVNKSTVSRSVNRAKKTLQDYLQFCL